MSVNTAINYNSIIDRIFDTLDASDKLFPEKNGASPVTPDIVRQIIKYEFPLPEQPPGGLGPPHIFINVAPNPIRSREPAGRGTRDVVARELLELEFWVVCITQVFDPRRAQQDLYDIVSAVETAIAKNRRLTKPADQTDPRAFGLTYQAVPYNLRTNTNEMAATNVIIRPKIFVDLLS